MTTRPALRLFARPRFCLALCAAAETALPVQTITREEIDKSGVTTAAELLRNVSANSNGLSDGASITDGTSG